MTVIACKLATLTNNLTINGDNSAVGVYHIDVDDPAQGAYSAVDQATWGLPGTTVDGLAAYLPQKYQGYGVSVGTPPANPPPGGAPPHRSETDLGAYALGVSVEKLDTGTRQRFIATVRWGPIPTSGGGSAAPENAGKQNPIDWDSTAFFEYQTETEIVENAYNVDGIVPPPGVQGRGVDTLGPIVNTAMERIETPPQQDVRRTVLVIQWNDWSDWKAYDLNAAYDKTINDDDIQIAGRTIKKHCARYAGCTASPPRYHQQVTGTTADDPDYKQNRYVTLQVRIELSKEPFYWPTISRGYNHWQEKENSTQYELVEATVGTLGTDAKAGISDTAEKAENRLKQCDQKPDDEKAACKATQGNIDIPSSEPVLLSSSGERLPKGTGTAVVVTFVS